MYQPPRPFELPSDLAAGITSLYRENADAKVIIDSLVKLAYDSGKEQSELVHKKARTDASASGSSSSSSSDSVVSKLKIFLGINLVSVVLPIRKKLNFFIGADPRGKTWVWVSSKEDGSTDDMYPATDTADFRCVACLPVPDRSGTPLFNIVFVPGGAAQELTTAPPQPLVFSVPEEPAKNAFDGSLFLQGKDKTQFMYKDLILLGCQGISLPISVPDTEIFGDKFHVLAHKGAREGYLFFMQNEVIFGFKKPLLCMNTEDIESISFSTITRLTFNINVVLKSAPDEVVEFSLIDQSHYGEIAAFIERIAVKNESFDDKLKAKTFMKNQQPDNILAVAQNEAENEVPVAYDDEDEEDDENYTGESSDSDGDADESDEEEAEEMAEQEREYDEELGDEEAEHDEDIER